jgi:hypothetical protein
LDTDDKDKSDRVDPPPPQGKPSGKRGRLLPAGTLGRRGATVMTIGPAQLEAIKRRREQEKREAQDKAAREDDTPPPGEKTD